MIDNDIKRKQEEGRGGERGRQGRDESGLRWEEERNFIRKVMVGRSGIEVNGVEERVRRWKLAWWGRIDGRVKEENERKRYKEGEV